MCVLYWHLISIWTSFMVRTKYLHDLNDKEGHRLTRSHWLAHLFTNSHHERPSHSIFCRCRQWTVRAVLRLTWDKWQLTGCHASQQWGKRTCLSFLELSGSAILCLSCVVCAHPLLQRRSVGEEHFCLVCHYEWRSTTYDTNTRNSVEWMDTTLHWLSGRTRWSVHSSVSSNS